MLLCRLSGLHHVLSLASQSLSNCRRIDAPPRSLLLSLNPAQREDFQQVRSDSSTHPATAVFTLNS